MDLTLVLDQIYGVLSLRLLLGHAPIQAGVGTSIVRNVVAGIRCPSRGSAAKTQSSVA
jgi:hypothetical protein